MYVYLDIIKLSLVSTSQVQIICFLLIIGKFQEMRRYIFYKFLYVKVDNKKYKNYNYKHLDRYW